MKRSVRLLALLALALAARPAAAHHALEYIETESYSTSRAGEWLFHLHYDLMSEDKDDPTQDHWELTPGLAYGITDRLMLDAHVHYAGFENGLIVEERQAEFEPHGPSPFVEAAAFTLQYRLTQGWPVNVAVAGTFELPMDRAEELLGSEEVYEGTLILAREFGTHGNVTLNLTAGWEGDEDYQEYALGVRNALTSDPHGVAAGVEILGDFDEFEDNWSVLPGIYFPLSEQTLVKTGLEIGNSQDYTRANVTLMHKF
jgi:hypothetical protein